MIANIFTCFFLQLLFTVGIVVVFGWLIALCNKLFYRNFGRDALTACYITGFIGTPIHECSHALMCLIFGHKVTEIKLFQIDSDDGTLGYVKHSYNRRNIYHRIGNFFIGVAPITVISAVLYLLAYFLLPGFVSGISGAIEINDFVHNFGAVFTGLWQVLKMFVLGITSWQWWVFVLVGCFLALHMTLSGLDIKGALDGLLFLVVAMLIADFIIGLISGRLLTTVTTAVLHVSSYLLCFLILALIISLISVLFSFVVRAIKR